MKKDKVMWSEEVKVLGKWRKVKWWDVKKLKWLSSEEGKVVRRKKLKWLTSEEFKVMRREEVKVTGKWRK